MRNDFAAAYGDKAEKVLATYHQLYGGQGFDKFIAIDDCDLAKFTIAVSAATAPQDAPGTAVSAVSRAARAPVPIVEGSCRKLMGNLLVTCKPNAVGGMYTVTNAGEFIADNVASGSLQLSFSPEAVRASKTIQAFEVVVDCDASYVLEELTHKVSAHRAAADSKKTSVAFPMPDGPVSEGKEHRLTIVTYLRTLTTYLSPPPLSW
jgi:hypothetical protein